MRIAVVSQLFETVPPTNYGATERVVYWLVEELVRYGHSVTLYAAAGSNTSAELISCSAGSLTELHLSKEENNAAHEAQLRKAFEQSQSYDLIHVHHGSWTCDPSLVKLCQAPLVWTHHANLWVLRNMFGPGFELLAEAGVGLTAISRSQADPYPWAKWYGVVHNGLPINLYTPIAATPRYLAFLGRICYGKGTAEAVQIAAEVGAELQVAARVEPKEVKYYNDTVQPLFCKHNVVFHGEIADGRKASFLSNATALLFPVMYPEAFGLVMIEAMACGCPVVAFDKGSVSEVVEDGVTGFVVDSVSAAAEAVRKVQSLDRKRIRQRFEERFTSRQMASGYVKVYDKVLSNTDPSEGSGKAQSEDSCRTKSPDSGIFLQSGLQ